MIALSFWCFSLFLPECLQARRLGFNRQLPVFTLDCNTFNSIADVLVLHKD